MINFIGKYLASQGRGGDNTLRNVQGKVSHVNPREAYWIDNYGTLGELATQATGSGTINPVTGLPEYWGWWDNTFGKDGLGGAIGDAWDETVGVGGLAGGIDDLFSGDLGNTMSGWTWQNNPVTDVINETIGTGGIGSLADNLLGDIWDETIGVEGLAGWVDSAFSGEMDWSGTGWWDNTIGKHGLGVGIGDIGDHTLGGGGIAGLWPSNPDIPNPYAEQSRLAPDTFEENDDLYTLYGEDIDWEEFKNMDPGDFIGLTDEQKWSIAADLAEYGDITQEDFQKYMPTYDMEEELYKREAGATAIAQTGMKRQAPLQQLKEKMDLLHTKQNFESTGNPMIDRQRFNIFADIGSENKEIWQGLLHDVDLQRTDFMEIFASDLIDYDTYRGSDEAAWTDPDEGFQFTEIWDYSIGKDGLVGFLDNLIFDDSSN